MIGDQKKKEETKLKGLRRSLVIPSLWRPAYTLLADVCQNKTAKEREIYNSKNKPYTDIHTNTCIVMNNNEQRQPQRSATND